ncbi:hypothetical protein ASPVEDRAFT_77642 [Aspergillus versicolor CBS 583.65]|uniref:Amidase domain-containing protein n=1 Tax=Aspergillus versicolor CBS 583.65 TaxID=1036611 RepID=A0A1L9P375_ASPVE|nr:uncharacterized protein ASPVEDRAFT_77642 [Aspergillus versicolor CBS 583.65]OJI95864.1 hypothetical protein ASPVEDRAFT_77642 [Aspergillus versicolor CBS 583.65]
MSSPPFQIPNWQQAAAEKRRRRDESIPLPHRLPLHPERGARRLLPADQEVLNCGILTPLDIEITDIGHAAVLLERIAKKQYTAVAVTEAYCKWASIAQQTYMEQSGKTAGVLHGLPVSLKDLYEVEGVHATAGLVSWIRNISSENPSITKGILAAGGIIYVKTNVSQGHLMVESINNIFGTTTNPLKPALKTLHCQYS